MTTVGQDRVERPASGRQSLLCRLRRHWPILAVLTVFVGTAFIVPTLAPAWVSDDWLYARAVEDRLHDRQLRIPNLSVATAVFQVVWGAFFAAIFGVTPGVLRVSTLALSVLGGVGTYGLGPGARCQTRARGAGCRRSAVRPPRLRARVQLHERRSVRVVTRCFDVPLCPRGEDGSEQAHAGRLGNSRPGLPGPPTGCPHPRRCALVARAAVRLAIGQGGLRIAARVAGIPALDHLHSRRTDRTAQPLRRDRPGGLAGGRRHNGPDGLRGSHVHRLVRAPDFRRGSRWRTTIACVPLVASLGCGNGLGRDRLHRLGRLHQVGPVHALCAPVRRLLGLGPERPTGGRFPIVGKTIQQWLTAATAANLAVDPYLLAHRFLGRSTAERPQGRDGLGGLVLAVAA